MIDIFLFLFLYCIYTSLIPLRFLHLHRVIFLQN